MFQVTMCPSSGETAVFMRHLVLVILCGWLSGMQEHMLLHTRIQNNKYQVSHKHSCFSWQWAHSRPKHVEIDKHTKKNFLQQVGFIYKIILQSPDDGHIVAQNMWRLINILRLNCATSWLYLQDYTGMHGQQNMISYSINFNIDLIWQF